MYGAVDADGACRRFWLVLDPMLRVLLVAPLENVGAVMEFMAGLPPCALHAGAALPAPVLVVPRVLEPGLCRHLIALYRADGGEESGFMLETEGRTVMTTDAAFKRRRDHQIRHEPTRVAIRERIERRLLPRSGRPSSSARRASSATSSPATMRARAGIFRRIATTPRRPPCIAVSR